MNIYELMSSYSVKVNEGSGVLVEAMQENCIYVLTAKHVLVEKNKVTDVHGTELLVLGVYPHQSLDCALLKVSCSDEIREQSTRSISELTHSVDMMLVGYPQNRRGQAVELKQQDATLTTMTGNQFVITANTIPPKEVIDGMSGGGVYSLQDGHAYLVGIETSMDGYTDSELFGRLSCIALKSFDEIISEHKLPPILPSFFNCFSRLKDSLFCYNVADPTNVEELKIQLASIADVLICNGLPAPYDILQKYSSMLLVSPSADNILHTKDIWLSYFEFVVICALIDNVDTTDIRYLNSLEKKRRILYSNENENWLRKLEDIIRFAKDTLDEGGTVLVDSPQENAVPIPSDVQLDRIIANIASSRQEGELLPRFDSAEDASCRTFTVAHLKGLRNKYVLDKEWDYGAMQKNDQLKLFRDLYNEIIK